MPSLDYSGRILNKKFSFFVEKKRTELSTNIFQIFSLSAIFRSKILQELGFFISEHCE
jgi:hypothetical protein